MKIRIFALLIFAFLYSGHAAAGVLPGTVLKGMVCDSVSGEHLGFVNVYVNASDGGGVTDEKGRFKFRTTQKTDSLRITCLGYITKFIPVNNKNAGNLKIKLVPSDFELSEVVVKPKKEKYSKKNNPAVEFLQRLRSASKAGDPTKQPFFSCDRQEKIALGLADFNPRTAEADGSESNLAFVNDYIDSVPGKDASVLKVIVHERHATDLYADYGNTRKSYVTASRHAGLDNAFPAGNITVFLNDLVRNVDIYDPTVTLIQSKFVSPLSPLAADYYKFYLDTIDFKGERHYQLSFLPHTPESMSFQGRLLVPVNDSTMTVRHVEMRVPRSINLNFVKDLYIEQDFELDSLNNRNKVREFLGADFHIISGTQALYAEKEAVNYNFSYSKREDLSPVYELPGTEHEYFYADSRDDNYWNRTRKIPLTPAEQKLDGLSEQMRSHSTLYAVFERVVKWLADGYISTSKTKSKFDIGNILSFIAYNQAEGLRLKVGGMTTAALSPHWFARGYVAYGFKDHKWKYEVEGEYSFNRKKRHSREFPMSAIRLSHSYDLFMMGQQYEGNNMNALLSITRKKNYKVTYRRLSSLTWVKEWTNHLSIELSFNHEQQIASKYLPFILSDGKRLSGYSQTYLSAKIRIAPGEAFIQGATNRTHVNLDAPIVWVKHEYGPKGFLGSRYNLNITSLSARYRLWFSSFGFADLSVTGAICWNAVDYPSLPWPNANLSYTIQSNSYSLMNPMEFAVDKYAAWDLKYCGMGILFNRIPLVKKLRLREVIGFKGLFGGISKKNNPYCNKSLFPFPEDAQAGFLDPGTPYMEMSAGIENILRLLRVEWVYRLTYRSRPGIDRWGIRFGLHFSF